MNRTHGSLSSLEEWRAHRERTADRYRAMQQDLARVRVTEQGAGGAITVVVDGAGSVVDVAMTDRLESLRPAEIGPAVLACIRRAQSRLVDEVARIAEARLGDEPGVTQLRERFRARFPEQPDEAPAPRWRRPAPRAASVARRERPRTTTDLDGDGWFDAPGVLR